MLAHYGSASYGEPVVSYIESDGSVRMNKAPNIIRVLGDGSAVKAYSSGKYYDDRSFFVSQLQAKKKNGKGY